jgi:hypothetical protein
MLNQEIIYDDDNDDAGLSCLLFRRLLGNEGSSRRRILVKHKSFYEEQKGLL